MGRSGEHRRIDRSGCRSLKIPRSSFRTRKEIWRLFFWPFDVQPPQSIWEFGLGISVYGYVSRGIPISPKDTCALCLCLTKTIHFEGAIVFYALWTRSGLHFSSIENVELVYVLKTKLFPVFFLSTSKRHPHFKSCIFLKKKITQYHSNR